MPDAWPGTEVTEWPGTEVNPSPTLPPGGQRGPSDEDLAGMQRRAGAAVASAQDIRSRTGYPSSAEAGQNMATPAEHHLRAQMEAEEEDITPAMLAQRSPAVEKGQAMLTAPLEAGQQTAVQGAQGVLQGFPFTQVGRQTEWDILKPGAYTLGQAFLPEEMAGRMAQPRDPTKAQFDALVQGGMDPRKAAWIAGITLGVANVAPFEGLNRIPGPAGAAGRARSLDELSQATKAGEQVKVNDLIDSMRQEITQQQQQAHGRMAQVLRDAADRMEVQRSLSEEEKLAQSMSAGKAPVTAPSESPEIARAQAAIKRGGSAIGAPEGAVPRPVQAKEAFGPERPAEISAPVQAERSLGPEAPPAPPPSATHLPGMGPLMSRAEELGYAPEDIAKMDQPTLEKAIQRAEAGTQMSRAELAQKVEAGKSWLRDNAGMTRGGGPLGDVLYDVGHGIYKAGMSFFDWGKAMKAALGDAIVPHLQRIWNVVQQTASAYKEFGVKGGTQYAASEAGNALGKAGGAIQRAIFPSGPDKLLRDAGWTRAPEKAVDMHMERTAHEALWTKIMGEAEKGLSGPEKARLADTDEAIVPRYARGETVPKMTPGLKNYMDTLKMVQDDMAQQRGITPMEGYGLPKSYTKEFQTALQTQRANDPYWQAMLKASDEGKLGFDLRKAAAEGRLSASDFDIHESRPVSTGTSAEKPRTLNLPEHLEVNGKMVPTYNTNPLEVMPGEIRKAAIRAAYKHNFTIEDPELMDRLIGRGESEGKNPTLDALREQHKAAINELVSRPGENGMPEYMDRKQRQAFRDILKNLNEMPAGGELSEALKNRPGWVKFATKLGLTGADVTNLTYAGTKAASNGWLIPGMEGEKYIHGYSAKAFGNFYKRLALGDSKLARTLRENGGLPSAKSVNMLSENIPGSMRRASETLTGAGRTTRAIQATAADTASDVMNALAKGAKAGDAKALDNIGVWAKENYMNPDAVARLRAGEVAPQDLRAYASQLASRSAHIGESPLAQTRWLKDSLAGEFAGKYMTYHRNLGNATDGAINAAKRGNWGPLITLGVGGATGSAIGASALYGLKKEFPKIFGKNHARNIGEAIKTAIYRFPLSMSMPIAQGDRVAEAGYAGWKQAQRAKGPYGRMLGGGVTALRLMPPGVQRTIEAGMGFSKKHPIKGPLQGFTQGSPLGNAVAGGANK